MNTATPHRSAQQRPQIDERSDYVPMSTVEAFIVPLLRRHIERMIYQVVSARPGEATRILDVGCGRQPFRKLVESIGCEYHSMDASQNKENSVEFVCCLDETLDDRLLYGD